MQSQKESLAASSARRGRTILFLSRRDVESLAIPFVRIVDVVRRTYAEKGRGLVQNPPKQGIEPSPGSTIRSMPAALPFLHVAGTKWVSDYPGNVSQRLPTLHAVIVLNDPDTGAPRAILEGTWITTARTAASTLLLARALAHPDSRRLGLVACGAQGRRNLHALASEFPLEVVRVYDSRRGHALGFAAEMSDRCGVDVVAVQTPQEAVADADLVVTSAPPHGEPAPIGASVLAPGAFACLLDQDSTFRAEAIAEADTFLTDDREQFEDVQRRGGLVGVPAPHQDVSELGLETNASRRGSAGRSVCMSLGLGALDVAVAEVVLEAAERAGVGTHLAL